MSNEAQEALTVRCQCAACAGTTSHALDCAVHNEPAYPAGPCDCCCEVCGAVPAAVTVKFPKITMRYCKSFACVVDMLRSIEAIQ